MDVLGSSRPALTLSPGFTSVSVDAKAPAWRVTHQERTDHELGSKLDGNWHHTTRREVNHKTKCSAMGKWQRLPSCSLRVVYLQYRLDDVKGA